MRLFATNGMLVVHVFNIQSLIFNQLWTLTGEKKGQLQHGQQSAQQAQDELFTISEHAMTAELGQEKWCLDSGARSHMCSDASQFVSTVSTERRLNLANRQLTPITAVGNAVLHIDDGHLERNATEGHPAGTRPAN